MRNKKISIIMLSALTSFTAIGAVAGAIAWFVPKAEISTEDTSVSGSTQGAYYDSGEGTRESPYIIKKPRHLYNLAWLQYLGYYNKDSENGKQYYFRLDDNVDMTGWTLPPIGTEQYPFIGNFNGNGYVVSNLATSNKYTDFQRHPSRVTSTYFNSNTNDKNNYPNIVGFFGVVGDYNGLYTAADDSTDNYSSAANNLYNLGLYNISVNTEATSTLAGIAAGYVCGNMSNVAVDSSRINFTATSAVTSYLGNDKPLSNHALVGYTTQEQQLTKIDETTYDVKVSSEHQFEASEGEGDDQGWGGSINMKTIYYRIVALRKAATNVTNTFQYRQNKTYLDNTLTNTTYSYGFSDSNYKDWRLNGATYNANHPYIGNYNLYTQADSYGPNTRTTDQSYLYMGGGHWENRDYNKSYTHTGYYISSSNRYLKTTDGTLDDVAYGDNPSIWYFTSTSGTSKIYTQYNGNTYYLRDNNHTLVTTTNENQGTSWTIENNDSAGTLKITNNGYKLLYSEGDFKLVSSAGSPVSLYVIKASNRYMTQNFGNVQTLGDSVASWETDSDGYIKIKDQALYLAASRSENPVLSLQANTSSDNYAYFKIQGNTIRADYSTGGCNSRTNYYIFIRYNNGFTPVRQTGNNGTNPPNNSVTYGQETYYVPVANFDNLAVDNLGDLQIDVAGPDTYPETERNAAESRMYYTATDTTYLPINVEEDINSYLDTKAKVDTYMNTVATNAKNGEGKLDPKSSNTGYIVAGSSLPSSGDRKGGSLLRISEYPISNVSASFDTDDTTFDDFEDAKVYTVPVGNDLKYLTNSGNNDGITAGSPSNMDDLYNETDYPRYEDSKFSFYKNSLTSAYNEGTGKYTVSNNVYGLHFMDSQITMNNIVNGNNVSILGKKCDNFELPVNSVDFNLKQKGVINFFAGTYFHVGESTFNNSFFTMYEVNRNDDASIKSAEDNTYYSYNTINNFKEIVAIYCCDEGSKISQYSNIYKYKLYDNNGDPYYEYSEPYRFDGSQNKFKMLVDSVADQSTPYIDGSYITADVSGDYNTVEKKLNKYIQTYGYELKYTYKQIGLQSTALTASAIYYFEIPMNSGEYCLGSVSGGNGAYLLYLDIGANAAQTQRTIAFERFIQKEDIFIIPVGVVLLDLPSTYTSGTKTITEDLDIYDSATVKITSADLSSSTVDLVMSRTVDLEIDKDEVVIERSSPGNSPPLYKGEGISLKDNVGNSLSVNPVESHSNDIIRVRYYDFNVNLTELMVTTITDTSVDGAAPTRTIRQETYAGADFNNTPTNVLIYDTSIDKNDSAKMKVYNTLTGVSIVPTTLINPSSFKLVNLNETVINAMSGVSSLSWDNEIYRFKATYQASQASTSAAIDAAISGLTGSGKFDVKIAKEAGANGDYTATYQVKNDDNNLNSDGYGYVYIHAYTGSDSNIYVDVEVYYDALITSRYVNFNDSIEYVVDRQLEVVEDTDVISGQYYKFEDYIVVITAKNNEETIDFDVVVIDKMNDRTVYYHDGSEKAKVLVTENGQHIVIPLP